MPHQSIKTSNSVYFAARQMLRIPPILERDTFAHFHPMSDQLLSIFYISSGNDADITYCRQTLFIHALPDRNVLSRKS
jgi:hypothetical protein